MPANAARASNSLSPFKQDHSLADAESRAARIPSDSLGLCPGLDASVRGAAAALDALFWVVGAAIWDRTRRRRHTTRQRVTLGRRANQTKLLGR